jgi:DNA-binding MarR family transcriptional regulator
MSRSSRRPATIANGDLGAAPDGDLDLAGDGISLILEEFLPYRLSVLTNTISRALARLYEERFGLTVAEWRVLAVLARFGAMSANAVCERTAMDKVQVSRAVARAADGGLVHRAVDEADRRRLVLSLTAQGRSVHDQIVPLAGDLQRHLLAALADDEVEPFYAMLDRLYGRALDLHAG